jgi:hypothetical protein
MKDYNRVAHRCCKMAIWKSIATGILLGAIGAAAGCGGYHNPSSGPMPGQMPRTYPMEHRWGQNPVDAPHDR